MRRLAERKVLVVGLGQTGLGLCRFLVKHRAEVTATDVRPASELSEAVAQLASLPVRLELGRPQPQEPLAYDLILLSPGVPPELPWLQEALRRGIPVYGELELAGWFLAKPVVAITGTNGKTTTTTLVGEMLAASGRRPVVGGNIGTPVVELLAAQETADSLVLEVSSFQLDTAPTFRPQAAALLNISADHLDRYPDLAAYAASKARIFANQERTDAAVLNLDDPEVAALKPRLISRIHGYSRQQPCKPGAWIQDGRIRVCLDRGLEAAFPLDAIALTGAHNLENIMAALLLALEAGATIDGCAQVLAKFTGLPHRVQWVARLNGVDFYDDSKGTNVGAVVRALACFDQRVILIAGGRDKGGDYGPLLPEIRRRVKKLILLGEAQEKMAAALGTAAPVALVPDLPTAVEAAFAAAAPGDVVLLSPACSSFDMFRDYAERGRVFQEAVRRLQHG